MINTRLRWDSNNKESYGTYVARKIRQYGITNFKTSYRKGKYKKNQIIYFMSEEDWNKIIEVAI